MTEFSQTDKDIRRKGILVKYTTMVLIAYAITQAIALVAWLTGLSSVRGVEIALVAAASMGMTALLIALIQSRTAISKRFANRVYFGQFVVWLVMYAIWFLTLREIRSVALFCALMALSFLLANAKLWHSLLIAVTAAVIQIAGSYFAIAHLGQPGSFRLEAFYTLCFLPAAFFVCALSGQYARQREEVTQAKRLAETRRDALAAETEKAHRLNAQLQEAVVQIREISIRDVLTGLYNRRHLMDMLEVAKKRADRTGQAFSIAILDIDYFKRINDSYGHQTGDQVLQGVARLLQQALRDTDLCARFGGEEFVLLLEQAGEDGGVIVAERVRGIVAAADFAALGQRFEVTASLGVTRYCANETVEQTVARADAALYQAKEAGRNRVAAAFAPVKQ